MSIMSAQKHSYKETPKKGDLVIFDFSGNHKAHTHIGLVTEVINSTAFKTVEGNTGNSDYTNGGYVLGQTRYNRQVNCFIRPKYKAEKEKTAALIEDGTVYKYAYKDPAGKSSKALKKLKKGDKVGLIADDGYGWSEVKSGNTTGFIMNKHLNTEGLSKFKTCTVKMDTYVQPYKNKELYPERKLTKGTKYTLICEIENGDFNGKKYIGIDKNRYYI